MASSINSTISCANCGIFGSTEIAYKCTQCSHYADGADESVQFLCDLCSAVHIRKGHSVVDQSNFSPAVCAEHKQICFEFCNQCDQILCPKCLGKHRKHDIISVDEKASEVRVNLFEKLSSMEVLQKDAIKKSQAVSAEVAVRKKDAEAAFDETKEIMRELGKALIDEIRAHTNELNGDKKRSKEHVDNIGKAESNVRNLLGQSNASMLINYPAIDKECKKLIESHSLIQQFEITTSKTKLPEKLSAIKKNILAVVEKNLRLQGKQDKMNASDSKNNSSVDDYFTHIVGVFTNNCFKLEQKEQIVLVTKIDLKKEDSSSDEHELIKLIKRDRSSSSFEVGDATIEQAYLLQSNIMIIVCSRPNNSKAAFLYKTNYERKFPTNPTQIRYPPIAL